MSTSEGFRRIIEVVRQAIFIWICLLVVAIAWLIWDDNYGKPPIHLGGTWIVFLSATCIVSYGIGKVIIWVLDGFTND